jgi:hypothetical protein
MKRPPIAILIISLPLIGFFFIVSNGLWRGLDAIRRFPTETVVAMQPVLEKAYEHRSETGQWPKSLDEIGIADVTMPPLATPRFEVIDDAVAEVRVHGPGHQALLFILFEDENLRENFWHLSSEYESREIPCTAKPW